MESNATEPKALVLDDQMKSDIATVIDVLKKVAVSQLRVLVFTDEMSKRALLCKVVELLFSKMTEEILKKILNGRPIPDKDRIELSRIALESEEIISRRRIDVA